MNYITIDGGTTNTRVTLWRDGKAYHTSAQGVGIRNTVLEGTNSSLKQGIRKGITEVLEKAEIGGESLAFLVGSGMITSSSGILEIPHIEAPVSMQSLAQAIVCVQAPEIHPSFPLYLVPGIKNHVPKDAPASFSNRDIMRGEEAETVGVIARCAITGPAVLIMPGSHTKFVYLDEKGRISGCTTSLAGELLMVLTQSTILSQALEGSFAHALDPEWLMQGAQVATREGLGRAAFQVRILDMFTQATQNQKANYLLGAVLSEDIRTLKNETYQSITPAHTLAVVGTSLAADAFHKLLTYETESFGTPLRVSGEAAENLAGAGCGYLMKMRQEETRETC